MSLSFPDSFLSRNQALQQPVFRRYLGFRFLLICALNMQTTILAYWIFHITNDVRSVGEMGLWEAVPAIGCSLFSGHIVDQKEKKTLLRNCTLIYLLLAVFFLSLTYAYGTHLQTTATVRLVYFGILTGGIVRAFIGPGTFSILGLLVPRSMYPNATAWSSTSWQVGAVAGPLTGGLMIGIAGVQNSFILVSSLLLLPLLAISSIPRQEIMKKVKEPIGLSLKKGMGFVFRSPVILSVLSLDMFAVLFGGAVALLPAYARDILQVGEMGFGMLRAAPGIGAIITMLLLSFIPLETKPGVKLLSCIAGFGICMIIFGLSTSFALSFVVLILSGMFDAVSVVIRGTILQLHTPDEMRGRVAAVNTMFISSSNELGEVESGYTAAWMGTVNSVVFGGSMTLVVVLVTLLAVPALRTLTLKK